MMHLPPAAAEFLVSHPTTSPDSSLWNVCIPAQESQLLVSAFPSRYEGGTYNGLVGVTVVLDELALMLVRDDVNWLGLGVSTNQMPREAAKPFCGTHLACCPCHPGGHVDRQYTTAPRGTRA